ncbi:MAG TPA: pilus assembly protein TadB [Eubacterium sp.]|jgi:tight adherence protein B|nr:pilus assembly protein TadB [Eubacterium sp.]
MAKKERIPQYVMSQLNTPMLNYRVYVIPTQKKIMLILGLFVIGGLLGQVFYGNLFLNSDGEMTKASYISNFVVFIIVGLIVKKVAYPMVLDRLKSKRKMELTNQFRSFLEAIAVSLSSGMNVPDALISANNDLRMEYSDDSYIVKEVQEMINGIQNNLSIEVMLKDFGARSEIIDIQNFSEVFAVGYRAGGNLKDIVRKTSDIIGDKIEMSAEIETAIASNKTQFDVMMIVPIVIIILLRTMSSQFAASFSTVAGVFATTVAIGIFVGAYKLGQKIMKITR